MNKDTQYKILYVYKEYNAVQKGNMNGIVLAIRGYNARFYVYKKYNAVQKGIMNDIVFAIRGSACGCPELARTVSLSSLGRSGEFCL